jgi:ATP-dependent Zn protease
MSDDNATEYHGEERRAFCMLHEERDRDIKEIREKIVDEVSPAIHRQTGQWRVFMWGAAIVTGSFMTALIIFGTFLFDYQKETRAMTKPIAEYMVSHEAKSQHGFRRIVGVEELAEENHESLGELKDIAKKNQLDIADIRKKLYNNNGRVAP